MSAFQSFIFNNNHSFLPHPPNKTTFYFHTILNLCSFFCRHQDITWYVKNPVAPINLLSKSIPTLTTRPTTLQTPIRHPLQGHILHQNLSAVLRQVVREATVIPTREHRALGVTDLGVTVQVTAQQQVAFCLVAPDTATIRTASEKISS